MPFTLGSFTITPYLADHSAYDAFSLLIEAGGRSLFYTGDIRGHGRKSSVFDRLLADPPSPIHATLMEGTSFRTQVTATERLMPTLTEDDVELQLADTLRNQGSCRGAGSAQNIDRLVTVYRAALRTDRDLVVDLYTADIAEATGRSSIPALGEAWPRIHVFTPLRQRVRVKETREFDRVARVKDRPLYAEQLRERAGQLVLFGAYQGEIPSLIHDGLLADGAVVWSLWDGYLDQPSGQRLQSVLKSASVPLIQHHTSGMPHRWTWRDSSKRCGRTRSFPFTLKHQTRTSRPSARSSNPMRTAPGGRYDNSWLDNQRRVSGAHRPGRRCPRRPAAPIQLLYDAST